MVDSASTTSERIPPCTRLEKVHQGATGCNVADVVLTFSTVAHRAVTGITPSVLNKHNKATVPRNLNNEVFLNIGLVTVAISPHRRLSYSSIATQDPLEKMSTTTVRVYKLKLS